MHPKLKFSFALVILFLSMFFVITSPFIEKKEYLNISIFMLALFAFITGIYFEKIGKAINAEKPDVGRAISVSPHFKNPRVDYAPYNKMQEPSYYPNIEVKKKINENGEVE